jgi:hypothetical protein
MDFGYLIIVSLIVVVLLIIFFLPRKKNGNRKVMKMNRHRKISTGKQACSYCKRKADPLSFYSDGRGKVVGVCNQCKPQAERQALMRI